MLVRPIKRKIASAISSSIKRSISDISSIQRYITEFLASAASFGNFTDEIVISVGQQYEVEVQFTSGGTAEQYLIDDKGGSNRLFVRIQASTGNVLSIGGATVTVDGGSNTAKDFRDGIVHTAIISGVASSELRVGNLGRRFNGTDYLDGHLVGIKVRKDGVLTDDFPLNEGPSIPYWANRAATLGGDELAVSSGASWAEAPTGTYTETGNFSSFLDLGGSAGNSYIFTYEDSLNSRVDNGTVSIDLTDGSGSIVVEGGTVAPRILGPNGAVITPKSLREIPAATPYITKQNVADAQTALYDQVDDGWTGPELEPAPFNISTWTATTGEILVPPNQIELGDAVGGAFKAYGMSGIHRLSVAASSEGTSMQIKDSSTGVGLDPDITTGNPINGTFDYDFVNGGVYFRTTGSGGDRVTINEYSLKRFLEVA